MIKLWWLFYSAYPPRDFSGRLRHRDKSWNGRFADLDITHTEPDLPHFPGCQLAHLQEQIRPEVSVVRSAEFLRPTERASTAANLSPHCFLRWSKILNTGANTKDAGTTTSLTSVASHRPSLLDCRWLFSLAGFLFVRERKTDGRLSVYERDRRPNIAVLGGY